LNKIERKPRVLFLARWYPNRYDPMPGLFIQRHAEAVVPFCHIGVVYTQVVEEGIRGYALDFEIIRNVPTARIYYSNHGLNIPLFGPIMKAIRFVRANLLGIKKIRKEIGGIDLIHVHILTRLGILALWYKWVKGIPYGISEHWSRYLKLTDDFKGSFRKRMTRLVVKNASFVTTVTQNLANAMQSHGLRNSNYVVLANVVTDVFLTRKTEDKLPEKRSTFIHVSCFEDKSKNISGLLRVFSRLSQQRDDFRLLLVGDGMDFTEMKDYAAELGIPGEIINFTGLLEREALADKMAVADLMVIFSNYENFPVVINESFVLGVPVFATKVGGIPEFVNKTNGMLLESRDEGRLLELLNQFLDGKITFDHQKIRETYRLDFAPETIGRQLADLYMKALDK
jgi:glycosyltransferase involved in cell wall biosynthesis